jgi:hypothetical protein
MCQVDRITARTWRNLEWRNPREDLVRLGILAGDLQRKGIPATHDDLRARDLRPYLERKQAALFAYFISAAVTKAPIEYAMHEAEDYDCLTRTKGEGKAYCQPVQLKEVAPTNLNASATIDGELQKLESKYPTPSKTVVAIHLNQTGPVIYAEIRKPNVPLAGIWLYGAATADQARWFLYGDLLMSPREYELAWPTAIE